ncbi:MAG: OPT family oligopeptide transporter, partial [Flavisolibacter sp.]
EELGKGNLFATGLVAGGALMGVIVAFITAADVGIENVSVEHGIQNVLGVNGYYFLGVIFFALMAYTLYRLGVKKGPRELKE